MQGFFYVNFCKFFLKKAKVLEKSADNYNTREKDKGAKMGLACSQVRLLTLISRKADNELETMLVSNKKLALSREQSELSQEYYSKLQTKKLNYYNDGAYCPITYSYLMGDSSLKSSFIDSYAASMITDSDVAAEYGISSITMPATKTDNSVILTDYRGLVVLNNEYANAIIAVCGDNVSCDGNGKGSTFKASYIPAIIAQYMGFAEGSKEYQAIIAVYNNDTAALEALELSTTNIDGTKEDGTVVEGGFTASNRIEAYQQMIDFYKPIFQACASNGWTTEYTSNLNDSDYMSNALTSGIFHLQTVDNYGEYEAGTSLQYYINAAFVTERRDSVEQEEITAWYNAEKEKIAAKEDYWDVQLQNLSTELSAIETEIESVQSLIDDAISSVFDWGA